MRIGAPQLDVGSSEASLAVRFEFDDPGLGSADVAFGVPAGLADRIERGASPFLPLGTLLAAHAGEDLVVEAPVSRTQLDGATRAAQIFADWWGYRRPAVDAPIVNLESSGAGVAVLYSRGVDTSATVVRSLRGDISERVTHLLCGDAIDWSFSDRVAREIWLDHERAAAEIGLPLVRLTSNARDVLQGLIGWPRSYGVVYIGAALTLGPMFSKLLTGATELKDRDDPAQQGPEGPVAEPRGSRWDLDPLWGTEVTTVRQDAAELSRTQRLEILSTHEPSLRWLKVCWEGRGVANCGRCMKCVRTMTALATLGALDRAQLFERPLTPEAVAAAPLRTRQPPITRAFVDEIPDHLPGLRAAWESKLSDWQRFKRTNEREARRDARRKAWRRKGRRIRRRMARLARRRA